MPRWATDRPLQKCSCLPWPLGPAGQAQWRKGPPSTNIHTGSPNGGRSLPRKAAERTVEGLWTTIGRLVDVFTPPECAISFAAAGYDAARGESALVGH
jgi:hypothetical protein